jgi:hypothetical protein
MNSGQVPNQKASSGSNKPVVWVLKVLCRVPDGTGFHYEYNILGQLTLAEHREVSPWRMLFGFSTILGRVQSRTPQQ